MLSALVPSPGLRSVLRGVLGGLLLIALCVAPTPAQDEPDERPNVLLIIADDVMYSDLSLYGGQNVETPNIDQLARDGLVFNHAYQSMSMCVPTRSELYTDQYPTTDGSAWNQVPSPVRPGTESIVHYFREMGYRVGVAGKKNVFPQRAFPFERVPGVQGNAIARTADYDPDSLRASMGRSDEEPFVLSAGFNLAHRPWTVGDPSHFDAETLDLPPYLVDTPETREYFARYLAEIEVLDRQVGRTLDVLEDVGKRDDSLVLFTSEQGAEFPRAKWTLWEQGVRTALIARWPGHVPRGTRTDALVHYVDVLPTLVEAVGGIRARAASPRTRWSSSLPTTARTTKGATGRPTLTRTGVSTVPSGTCTRAASGCLRLRGGPVASTRIRPPTIPVTLATTWSPSRPLPAPSPPTVSTASRCGPRCEGRRRRRSTTSICTGSLMTNRPCVGRWKAVSPSIGSGPIELYDLPVDSDESNDVAENHPDVAERMAAQMNAEHTPRE